MSGNLKCFLYNLVRYNLVYNIWLIGYSATSLLRLPTHFVEIEMTSFDKLHETDDSKQFKIIKLGN